VVYLDKECYQTFKKREGFLEYFGIIFSEFEKNNSKICQNHREEMRRLSEKFHKSIIKATLLKTKEERLKIQQSKYPILINILCDQVRQYKCLEGTEYALALLPDWRRNFNIPRKKACFDSKYMDYYQNENSDWYHAINIYINKNYPCK